MFYPVLLAVSADYLFCCFSFVLFCVLHWYNFIIYTIHVVSLFARPGCCVQIFYLFSTPAASPRQSVPERSRYLLIIDYFRDTPAILLFTIIDIDWRPWPQSPSSVWSIYHASWCLRARPASLCRPGVRASSLQISSVLGLKAALLAVHLLIFVSSPGGMSPGETFLAKIKRFYLFLTA